LERFTTLAQVYVKEKKAQQVQNIKEITKNDTIKTKEELRD